jgi:hypothetical protein
MGTELLQADRRMDRTNGQTDITKLVVTFPNSLNAVKNWQFNSADTFILSDHTNFEIIISSMSNCTKLSLPTRLSDYNLYQFLNFALCST